jgi:hypothetical protein
MPRIADGLPTVPPDRAYWQMLLVPDDAVCHNDGEINAMLAYASDAAHRTDDSHILL